MKNLLVCMMLIAGVAASSWQGDTELDAMTDAPIRSLWSRAISGSNGRGIRPVLYIRFTGDPVSVPDEDSLAAAGMAHFSHPEGVPIVDVEYYIYWDTYVGSSGLACQGRIDDSTAVSYSLSASTSNTSTFFSLNPLEKARLFRELLEGSQFTVRFTPYGENPITAVFSCMTNLHVLRSSPGQGIS